jgi:hypothetical protein
MQGYSILKTVFDFLLETGLVSSVFHSVQIKETETERFPAFPLANGDFQYVGLDDSKIMNCYIRQVEDLRVIKVDRISSNQNEYDCRIAHRAVFFNDNETRNTDDLLNTFIQLAFLPGTILTRVIVDPDKLQQLESKIDGFEFSSNSFYCAVDFDILLRLQKNNCKIEITCSNVPNPYC